MGLLERLRSGSWSAVGIFLCIVLGTLLVLVVVLKRTAATHLTIGSAVVMLMYLAVAAFLVLASRLFVPSGTPSDRQE